MVVIGLGYDFLFKSLLGHCACACLLDYKCFFYLQNCVFSSGFFLCDLQKVTMKCNEKTMIEASIIMAKNSNSYCSSEGKNEPDKKSTAHSVLEWI